MPFGFKMYQDILQKKIDQTYYNTVGAVGIADDIQVYNNDNTHDLNQNETMERMRRAGIKLTYDTCFGKF